MLAKHLDLQPTLGSVLFRVSSPLSSNECTLQVTNLADATGRRIIEFVLPVVAVVTLNATPAMIGVLNAVETTAFLLLGIPVGVLVDRVPIRKMLLGSYAAKIIVAASIFTLLLLDSIEISHLLLAAGATGIAVLVAETTQTAAVPQVTDRGGIVNLFSRLQAADSAAALVIPAIAGIVISTLGAPVLVAVSAVSTILALFAIAWLRPPSLLPPPAQEGRSGGRGSLKSFVQDAKEGILVLRQDPRVRALTGITMLTNAGLAVGATVETVYVLRVLDLSTSVFGIMLSVGGGGALVGSLVASKAIAKLGARRIVIFGTLLQVPIAAVLPLASYAPAQAGSPAVIAQAGLWGFVIVVSNIAQGGWVASFVPMGILGRVSSTQRTLTTGVVPLGSLLGGGGASLVGVVPILWAWTALAAAAAAWTLSLSKKSLSAAPDDLTLAKKD